MATSGPNAPLPGGVDPLKRISEGSSAKAQKSQDAPAFKALLDRLEAQARELSEERGSVDRPEDLSQATEHARQSLTDALELRDQLLEAYRQAQQTGTADGGAEGASEE